MRNIEFLIVLSVICIIACDKNDNPISNQENNAPVIQAITFNPDTLRSNESCLVKVIVSDPDNDELKYQWSSSGTLSPNKPDPSRIFFFPGLCCGPPTITILVEDGNGGSDDSTISIPLLR
jgi:hypothetical protein